MKPSGAFSLLELLVVIAVIGILAALSVPVVNAVKVRSESARSTGSLRSIAAAWSAYAAENNGNYPPYPPTGTPRTTLGWRAVSMMRNIVTPSVQVTVTEFGNNEAGLASAEYFYTPLQTAIPMPPKGRFFISGPYQNEIGYNILLLRPEGMGNREGFGEFWNHNISCPPTNPLIVDRCLSLWSQPATKDGLCRILHLGGHVSILPVDELNAGITTTGDANWQKLLKRMKTGQTNP